ncbi:type IV secretory pathway VirB2 component (pilin) [Sphingomonas naasensis]|uniref:Type VI secretion protein n=1 Tax=Sphingomonas naasensis TaxID=1344951 RepID=A0A4S1W517_9SPHN|nr:TrbC/VirB2 family protein [Sphingomonas naasensis]NIJ20016.1 type IV secretory pathway VirB2 component (pilin) [Sphingomonas naasensis]TGX37961.1 hypothetical protein E5A74_19565 [Sphingomonas naasensis]
MAATALSTFALTYAASLAEPTGQSALNAAVRWLEGTLLGTVATTIAVLAVASVGYGALTGRIDLRRGATVVIGCFVLFGASSIAAGLQGLVAGDAPAEAADMGQAEISPLAELPPRQSGYDPYAGAAVPQR